MEGWIWPWAWAFLSIPQEWPRKHSDKSSIDFFFQPLSILISLENGQIHLHRKSWRTFRTFPGKCRENDCSGIFCLKNGVTWVTPFSIGKFPWGYTCKSTGHFTFWGGENRPFFSPARIYLLDYQPCGCPQAIRPNGCLFWFVRLCCLLFCFCLFVFELGFWFMLACPHSLVTRRGWMKKQMAIMMTLVWGDKWIRVGKYYPSIETWGQLENAQTQYPHLGTCGFYVWTMLAHILLQYKLGDN